MAFITIFDMNFSLDVAADVSIDFSAGQSYSTTSGSHPWQATILIDGAQNLTRGGSGALTDVIQMMGAAGQLAAGNHNVQIQWAGDTVITLFGAVLRILVTRR